MEATHLITVLIAFCFGAGCGLLAAWTLWTRAERRRWSCCALVIAEARPIVPAPEVSSPSPSADGATTA